MIEIVIPLPPRALSPNTYKHHFAVSNAKRSYRQRAHQEALAATTYPQRICVTPMRIECEWFMGKGQLDAYRPLDEQNANSSIKAAVDGLVDSGVLKADSYKWLKWGPTIFRRTEIEHRKVSAVVIRLYPITDPCPSTGQRA